MNKKLRIKRYILGPVSTNCYFLINEETKQVIVIDPAEDSIFIEKVIEEEALELCGILLTHGHFDHIMAAEDLRKKSSVNIYAMGEEKELLETPKMNLSTEIGRPVKVTPDVLLKDGEIVNLAGFEIKAIHTPGHTIGGGCFYLEEGKTLFSGDTLFYESIGRTDLPTGSTSQIIRSIKDKLMELDDQVKVYPGHGDFTSIGHEGQYNPYLA